MDDTAKDPFAVAEEHPTIAISLPIESPCGIVVVTGTLCPEAQPNVGVPPICALENRDPVKIAVLLLSKIFVIPVVFIALASYVNEVDPLLVFTIKFPFAIFK